MEIVPAILAEGLDQFVTRIRQAEEFARYIQIDIMDGRFVETKSIDAEMISSIAISIPFEIHMMVQEPLKSLRHIHTPSFKRAIFHLEASGDPSEFIAQAGLRDVDVGLAIKPETPLLDFEDLAHHVSTLLFLTVDPGRYGSLFRPEVMEKVQSARQKFPHKRIGVDGGVSLDNLHMFYNAGVDYVCIGSRIFLEGNPKENYMVFRDQLNDLETSK